jgi:hypothetical protein
MLPNKCPVILTDIWLRLLLKVDALIFQTSRLLFQVELFSFLNSKTICKGKILAISDNISISYIFYMHFIKLVTFISTKDLLVGMKWNKNKIKIKKSWKYEIKRKVDIDYHFAFCYLIVSLADFYFCDPNIVTDQFIIHNHTPIFVSI